MATTVKPFHSIDVDGKSHFGINELPALTSFKYSLTYWTNPDSNCHQFDSQYPSVGAPTNVKSAFLPWQGLDKERSRATCVIIACDYRHSMARMVIEIVGQPSSFAVPCCPRQREG